MNIKMKIETVLFLLSKVVFVISMGKIYQEYTLTVFFFLVAWSRHGKGCCLESGARKYITRSSTEQLKDPIWYLLIKNLRDKL